MQAPGNARVQKLHLVGFTTDRDGLILSARRGARSGGYVLLVDDAVVEAVTEVRDGQLAAAVEADAATPPPPERPSSRLSVREIQDRLRAGRSVDAVAKAADVDPAWVERFAAPVFAERAEVIGKVRGAHLERARLGRSARPVGDAVLAALADRGISLSADEFDRGWSAKEAADGRWIVQYRVRYRAKDHVLGFEVDAARRDVRATTRPASQWGYVAPDQRAPGGKGGAARRGGTGAGPVAAGESVERVPDTRSARERERAFAAMERAAAERARAAEAAAARLAAERKAAAEQAAKEEERRRREEEREAARRERERARAAAARKQARKKAAREKAAATKAASKAAASKQASSKKASSKKAASKKASTKKASTERASTEKGASRKATSRKAASKRAVAKRAVARTAAAKGAPVKKVAGTGTLARQAVARADTNETTATTAPASTAGAARGVERRPARRPRHRPDLADATPAPSAPSSPDATRRRAPLRATPTPEGASARPTFRTGLVESAGDAPAASPNGAAARPRRRRPLRAR